MLFNVGLQNPSRRTAGRHLLLEEGRKVTDAGLTASDEAPPTRVRTICPSSGLLLFNVGQLNPSHRTAERYIILRRGSRGKRRWFDGLRGSTSCSGGDHGKCKQGVQSLFLFQSGAGILQLNSVRVLRIFSDQLAARLFHIWWKGILFGCHIGISRNAPVQKRNLIESPKQHGNTAPQSSWGILGVFRKHSAASVIPEDLLTRRVFRLQVIEEGLLLKVASSSCTDFHNRPAGRFYVFASTGFVNPEKELG